MSKLSEKFAAGRKALAAKSPEAPPAEKAVLPFVRAPGPLHGSVSTMKIDMLKGEVERLRAASPVLKIDAKEIRRSAWANRHEDAFKEASFEELKAEILSAGGNVQPIKVRPIDVDTDIFKYEIIYGHRRHQACLELGLQVAAVIEPLSDVELFVEMDRENRQRKDLRPYEQGLMYRRALDKGLFPSIRKMAESIGIDVGNLSKSLSLARLPDAVLFAFASPLEIQLAWASQLNQALSNNPEITLNVALRICEENPRPPAKIVLVRLLSANPGGVVSNNTLKTKQKLTGAAGQSGTMTKDFQAKKFSLQLANIDPARMNELEAMIKTFLGIDS